MRHVAGLALRLYAVLLRLYPRAFRAEFEDEMQTVFAEALTQTAEGHALGPFVLRELRDMLPALARAHWHAWATKWASGMNRFRAAASAADLPPPPPDGRSSWWQAGLELGLFLAAGLALIGVTYLVPARAPAGWQHDLAALGRAIVPVTLPVTLIGLARALPRWAYPSIGLLVSFYALAAIQSGLGLFLGVMLLAAILLALLAFLTDAQLSPLPTPVRRVGQSLSLDWTRLSLSMYGAMPLAIIHAFDDAQTNLRTPYLAVSVVAMIGGALCYSRSRTSAAQIGALLGGASLSIWAALLDKAAFAAGLGNWIAAPRPATGDVLQILTDWVGWAALILAPALLSLAGHAAKQQRTL
jgi:hypothetical protein